MWRFSVVLTFNFDLDFLKVNSVVKFHTDAEHLCQISWKSDMYFSRNHSERNERTNQPTIPAGGNNDNYSVA